MSYDYRKVGDGYEVYNILTNESKSLVSSKDDAIISMRALYTQAINEVDVGNANSPVGSRLFIGKKSIGDIAKDWISGLFKGEPNYDYNQVPDPQNLRPIYLTKDNKGKVRAHIIFSNNFKDRHGQTIPEVVHTEYIDWANKYKQNLEFQIWHRGSKSKWGESDLVTRTGHFTIASGPVDPDKIVLAEALASDPNTGVSNGYYALYGPGKKEFLMWFPYEVSALDSNHVANRFMNYQAYDNVVEGEIAMTPQEKQILIERGVKSEFLDGLDEAVKNRGAAVVSSGVAFKSEDGQPSLMAQQLTELITTVMDAKLAPIQAQLIEQGQKSYMTKEDLSTELDSLFASKAQQFQQGFKASESTTNHPQGKFDGSDDMNNPWLGNQIDAILQASGIGSN